MAEIAPRNEDDNPVPPLDCVQEASREVKIRNSEGLHARPVMRFVDLACTFASDIRVTNVTRGSEAADGKSAMQMMLLEATQGSVLRIEAKGPDACEAVDALAALVDAHFEPPAAPSPDEPEA